MSRGARGIKNLKVDASVTQKPWWNQPIFQTLLTGLFGLFCALITWYLTKPNPNFDQEVIGNSNVSYVDLNLSRFRFNSEDENLIDVMLPVHVNGGADTSIYFNRGNGFELISSSKGQSDFPIIFSHLQCNVKYYFRIDPILNGKPLKGTLSHFTLPSCSTLEERNSAMLDPHYIESFYLPPLKSGS